MKAIEVALKRLCTSLLINLFERSLTRQSYSMYRVAQAIARALHARHSSRTRSRPMVGGEKLEPQSLQPWKVDFPSKHLHLTVADPAEALSSWITAYHSWQGLFAFPQCCHTSPPTPYSHFTAFAAQGQGALSFGGGGCLVDADLRS